MAYKFEDKFVHFRWDDSLKGKKVFYADSICCLEQDVTEGEDIRVLIGASETPTCPFLIEGEGEVSNINWKFVYYDPNYEVKLAYEEGKQIQRLDGLWVDDEEPEWIEGLKYRVKPEEDEDEKVLDWTNLNIGDIIETFMGLHRTAMVTLIDSDDEDWGKHIYAGNQWISDVDLKGWRKVKNG